MFLLTSYLGITLFCSILNRVFIKGGDRVFKLSRAFRILVAIIYFVSLFPFTTHSADAVHETIPTLGDCPDPGGVLVASYSQGWHWIPGDGLQYGADFVYRVGDNMFVQCYFPLPEPNGQTTSDLTAGIQSSWIHEENLTPEQETFLLSQGWFNIQQGSDFGLPAGRYLVKNSLFTLPDDGNGGGGNVVIIQRNSANISNKVDVNLNTGGNEIKGDTGGDTSLTTGDVDAEVSINNKVNANFAVVQTGRMDGLEAFVSNNGSDSSNQISINAEDVESLRNFH